MGGFLSIKSHATIRKHFTFEDYVISIAKGTDCFYIIDHVYCP